MPCTSSSCKQTSRVRERGRESPTLRRCMYRAEEEEEIYLYRHALLASLSVLQDIVGDRSIWEFEERERVACERRQQERKGKKLVFCGPSSGVSFSLPWDFFFAPRFSFLSVVRIEESIVVLSPSLDLTKDLVDPSFFSSSSTDGGMERVWTLLVLSSSSFSSPGKDTDSIELSQSRWETRRRIFFF